MKGWECPKCGKVNAPHVDACDHEQIGRTASNNREVVYVLYERPEAADRWWPYDPGYPIITYDITTDASDKYKAEMEAWMDCK